jgi:hypothetical protein
MSACYSHPAIGIYLATIIKITGLSSNKYVSSMFIQITEENMPILVENIVKHYLFKVKCSKQNTCLQT